MTRFGRLVTNEAGTAAAEMALVLPLLLTLMFGAFETGNYFLSEHVVDKAVRDAARYAARLPMTNYDCSGPTVDPAAEADIQHVARYGDPDGTTARLAGWTADSMATVTLTCDTNTDDSYVNNGVYADFPNGGEVPVIRVSAQVPYNVLFGILGKTTMQLNAASQAAVAGA